MFANQLWQRATKICPTKLYRVLLILAVTAGALLVPLRVAPAQAAVGDLTCTAVWQIDFSPALTTSHTTSNASMVVGLSNCMSLNGHYSKLKAGTITGSGPAQSLGGLPCSLVLTIQFKLHINWTDGQQSELNATVNSDPSAGTLGFNGRVTGGVLAGDSVTALGPFVPNADCLLNGLTSLVGTNQKLFS